MTPSSTGVCLVAKRNLLRKCSKLRKPLPRRFKSFTLRFMDSMGPLRTERLCERGIFQNKDRMITSLISREEFYALQSEKFVNDTFEGSLPAFLAAFGSRKKLSDMEVEELKKVIDSMRR